MRQNAKFFALFLLVAMGAASQYAQAANLSVNCDKHESISKVLHLLAKTNSVGPNIVTVSGGCNENLVIRSMDRLTLITKTGASLTDRSGGNSVVVDIEDSHSVTVQGFTINSGTGGVSCNTASVCYLTGNTIQDSAGIGLFVGGASHAFLVACRGDCVSKKAATARPLHRSPLAQTGRFLGFTIPHDSGMSLDLVISNIVWPNFSCGNSR
jgi:hypothetical protein